MKEYSILIVGPSLIPERPIIIYGKYQNADQGNITIAGDYADGIISSTLDFSDYIAGADENVALKYLWARKKRQWIFVLN